MRVDPDIPEDLAAAEANASSLVHSTHLLIRIDHDCDPALHGSLLFQTGIDDYSISILKKFIKALSSHSMLYFNFLGQAPCNLPVLPRPGAYTIASNFMGAKEGEKLPISLH